MSEIATVARLARSAGMSYGKYVASGRPAAGGAAPVCAECPQCSVYKGCDGGPARFCNAMNRPVEAAVRARPPWCWLLTFEREEA